MTQGVHPFPSRTRKLSPVVPKIVLWRRSVKIGRCQHPIMRFFYFLLTSVEGKVQLGEPKDVTINSLLMTQGVHPASSRTSLIESRSCDPLSYRFVTRPFSKKRGFSETTFPEHGVKPCSAEDSALETRCENRRYAYHDANIR